MYALLYTSGCVNAINGNNRPKEVLSVKKIAYQLREDLLKEDWKHF